MSPLQLALAVFAVVLIVVVGAAMRFAAMLRAPFAEGCDLTEFKDDTGREADGFTDYSIQTAILSMPARHMRRLWSKDVSIELGRAYWRQMKSLSLGLLMVKETDEWIRVRFRLFPPLLIFQFSKPEYEFSDEKASVTWHIHGGLVVNRAGRYQGTISISVSPQESEVPDKINLKLEMALRNFRPLFWRGRRHLVYRHTQSRYHVVLVYSFFRRLASVGPLS